MKIVVFFTLALISQSLLSQNIDYKQIDSLVRFSQIPKDISITDLPRLLTKPFRNKTEKVCAIYCWMSQNIKYDYVGFRNNTWKNYPSDSSLIFDTYNNRKGVCSGYSHLFKYFLDRIKIPAVVIDGFARVDKETFYPKESNHSWNAIEINKEWYLFDVTWSSDSTNKETDFFWFMTKPEEFIVSHYPEDTKWTLLPKQIPLGTFLKYPVITKRFFTLGFSKTFPKSGIIKKPLGENVRIYFKPSIECLLLPRVYKLVNGEKIEFKSKNAKDQSYIDFNFTERGSYYITISVLIQGESGFTIYENMLIYNIIIL